MALLWCLGIKVCDLQTYYKGTKLSMWLPSLRHNAAVSVFILAGVRYSSSPRGEIDPETINARPLLFATHAIHHGQSLPRKIKEHHQTFSPSQDDMLRVGAAMASLWPSELLPLLLQVPLK